MVYKAIFAPLTAREPRRRLCVGSFEGFGSTCAEQRFPDVPHEAAAVLVHLGFALALLGFLQADVLAIIAQHGAACTQKTQGNAHAYHIRLGTRAHHCTVWAPPAPSARTAGILLSSATTP